MIVEDLLRTVSEYTPIFILTNCNYTILAQDRRDVYKFKNAEISSLNAGTTKGKFGRQSIICAYVDEEWVNVLYEDED